ncbi:LEAF RUST 10 DISEASE-RESISTANCE LOCUS RECEPTOR-LIKE PROTEIN KINASE-like 2.4 [Actinidia eriantha]|uniref:LEAF RUST 10 DISEASE-RESISTANCE LOCUS RECEPTOR-LIKE PROTEIN KINASE-like 2.4 n=1 Tax=Actinidia eriantha TaxID=165200 RepID=UPI00258FFCCE|nr:LEAF RUST 10 DISEASE-RESISTANCE LOCUS RECEPTOR-LIKE PROTEIN KINASE-like 2.4 [Actinidia eriantha]
MSWTRLLYTAVIVAHFFANSSDAKTSPQCAYPSSCGDLHNITRPFRFRGDPENCGNKKYELECENNRTVVHLLSRKYNVLAINNNNYTIRIVDVGIRNGNCSSLPLYSLSYYNIYSDELEPYSLLERYGGPGGLPFDVGVAAWVDCEKEVKSNSLYTSNTSTASTCIQKATSSSLSSGKKHSYLLFGSLRVKDVADGCRIDKIIISTLWLPGNTTHQGNVSSFVDFHNKLAYGFELSWVSGFCEDCQAQAGYCYTDYYPSSVTCDFYTNFYTNFKRRFLDRLADFFYYQVLPRLKVPGWILVGRTSCGILCLFVFLIYKYRRRHLSMFDSIEGFLQRQNNLMPVRYSYLDIKIMTKLFKDKLGEGGYGCVYKGTLRSGSVAAIKVLGKSKANGQEFINEVATIGRIHHVNVVRLIGYCATRSKRALVYEFMPNGSLEKYIFLQEGTISLSCKKMYEIALGVAHGIDYLHRGCDMQILHFDIKPHNILLDENFNAKVSDFGLAKLYPTDNSMVSLTKARGTMGYMAPELFYKNIGRVSYKADVYSFGMLLMEMAGRRRNLNAFADHTSQIYFPSWIYDQFKEGKEIEMGESTEEEKQMVKNMVITALWCIQMKPSDRPSMNKVVEMLEGNVELLEMPPKPFLTPQEIPAEDQ